SRSTSTRQLTGLFATAHWPDARAQAAEGDLSLFAHSGDASSRTRNPGCFNDFHLRRAEHSLSAPVHASRYLPILGVRGRDVLPPRPAEAALPATGRWGQGSRSDGPWPLGLDAVARRWL